MKWFNTILGACVFLFMLSNRASAGWDISGSHNEAHQRIVHHSRPHVEARPRMTTPAQKTVHYRRARNYKDYLPAAYRSPIEPESDSVSSPPRVSRVESSTMLHPHSTQHRRPQEYGGMYAITINGSIKDNLSRVMSRYNWRVAWTVPYDYNFDGRVTGSSLPNVVEKLLKPFPLRAVMYMSNRTLAVVPRERVN